MLSTAASPVVAAGDVSVSCKHDGAIVTLQRHPLAERHNFGALHPALAGRHRGVEAKAHAAHLAWWGATEGTGGWGSVSSASVQGNGWPEQVPQALKRVQRPAGLKERHAGTALWHPTGLALAHGGRSSREHIEESPVAHLGKPGL